jgi:hypothetical protein
MVADPEVSNDGARLTGRIGRFFWDARLVGFLADIAILLPTTLCPKYPDQQESSRDEKTERS